MAIAVFPPPVTGMTLMNERFLKRITQDGIVVYKFNLGSVLKSRFLFKISKLIAMIIAPWLMLFNRIFRKVKTFYHPANSNLGLLYTFILVVSARLIGGRTILHHHSYAYIHTKRNLMSLVAKFMSSRDLQIFLCPDHQSRYQRIYNGRYQASILPNYFFLDTKDISLKPEKPDNPYRLGHLSNLDVNKGIDEVIKIFTELINNFPALELYIAGPFKSDYEKNLVNDICKSYPDNVKYFGPLYDDAKDQFFDSIDMFLFPSKYKIETQPLVLAEAQSKGVPVITYNIGCIGNNMQMGGVVVEVGRSSELVDKLTSLLNNIDQYRELVNDATKNIKNLILSSQKHYKKVLSEL